MSDVKSAEQIAAEAEQAKAAKKAAADEAKAMKAAEAAKAKAAKAEAALAAKALKEAAVAAAKAEKDAAAVAKAEAKAKAAAEKAATGVTKEKVVMPSQHGITRPKPGTKTAEVWAIADRLSSVKMAAVAISELSPECAAAGLNDATTRTQYARWKQFNGVFGPVAKTPVAAPAEVAPVAAAA